VTILAQGGVYAGDGEQVVFDNLRVSTVPLPASLPMFLAALGDIWLLARRRLPDSRWAWNQGFWSASSRTSDGVAPNWRRKQRLK
jgi:hypothetical protein